MDARELAALNGQLAIRLREGASRMASVMRGAAGMGRARDRKFADSPLERAGFELLVPLRRNSIKYAMWAPRAAPPARRGTDPGRDEKFESCLLHRRVRCEPAPLVAHNPRQIMLLTVKSATEGERHRIHRSNRGRACQNGCVPHEL
jgi:hypothetical protein